MMVSGGFSIGERAVGGGGGESRGNGGGGSRGRGTNIYLRQEY